ncbi:MAG: hypothetical protein U0822_01230 [Anaerolineae bacterium]
MADVLILVDDLFFTVQIENAARAVGLRPINGPGPGVAAALGSEALRLVVLDLSLREQAWADLMAQVRNARPDVPVLAFGPHVDVTSRRAAEAAGATRVVTKQQLVADLPGLLRRYAGLTE